MSRISIDPLHGLDRLPMACDSQGLSALLDRARVFLCSVAQGFAGAHQPHAGHGPARDRWARGVIGNQSVKTTECGSPRGFDAGRKTKGRKHHIVTDTKGCLVGVQVHPADIHDRDGAPDLLALICSLYPWLRHVFADDGCVGDKLRDAMATLGQWSFEIIKRSDTARGFELLPRRWVVERTLAWIGPMPSPREGLRSHHPERRRMDTRRRHPPPHKKVGVRMKCRQSL
jgi:transposase